MSSDTAVLGRLRKTEANIFVAFFIKMHLNIVKFSANGVIKMGKVLRSRCFFKDALPVPGEMGASVPFLTFYTTVVLAAINNDNVPYIPSNKITVILPEETTVLPFLPVYMNTRYVSCGLLQF